jgi:hypothetical protein
MSDKNQGKIDLIKQNLIIKSKCYRVFDAPDGKEVLEDLKQTFIPDIISGMDDNQTQILIKAAQRDVVRYIELKINAGKMEIPE